MLLVLNDSTPVTDIYPHKESVHVLKKMPSIHLSDLCIDPSIINIHNLSNDQSINQTINNSISQDINKSVCLSIYGSMHIYDLINIIYLSFYLSSPGHLAADKQVRRSSQK